MLAFVLEENGFPTAPAILGVVLGTMLEENFITLDDQARRQPVAFFTRPIAGGLAVATLAHPLLAARRRCAGAQRRAGH